MNEALVYQLGIGLFKKAVYFTNSIFSSLSIQEGGLFKRAVLSRAYGRLLLEFYFAQAIDLKCFKSSFLKGAILFTTNTANTLYVILRYFFVNRFK